MQKELYLRREAQSSLLITTYKEKDKKNLYHTCKHFDLNSKTVLRWIKDEEKIRNRKRGSR